MLFVLDNDGSRLIASRFAVSFGLRCWEVYRQRDTRFGVFLLWVLCLFVFLSPNSACAQTRHRATIWLNQGHRFWLNNNAWSNGIPNGPGAIAAIDDIQANSEILLTDNIPIIAGQLIYSGGSSFELNGGRLFLQESLDSVTQPLVAIRDFGEIRIEAPIVGVNDWTVDVARQADVILNGPITGQSLTKVGPGDLTLGGDNTAFEGDIHLNDGSTTVTHPNALGGTAGATYVAGGIELKTDLPVDETFFLETGAALWGIGLPELSGDIHILGPSRLSSRLSPDAEMVLSGSLHGEGDMILTYGRVVVTNNDHTLSGDVVLRSEFGRELILAGNGTLSTPSAIQLGQSGQLRPEPQLQLDNRETTVQDRIADHIPVIANGGGIELLGSNRQTPVSETIGRLELLDGNLGLLTEGVNVSLNIEEFTRSPVSTMYVRGTGIQSPAFTNTNGILGGWATFVEKDFATVTSDGLAVLSDFTPIGEATRGDHVEIATPEATATRTIESLILRQDQTLDIDGQLNVAGGGIIMLRRSAIRGGEITTGIDAAGGNPMEADSGKNYLYFHGNGGEVAATITNSGDTELAVVMNGRVDFSAANNYTGGTTVVKTGLITVRHPKGLPVGSDVDLVGGFVDVKTNGILEFDELTFRNNGQMSRDFAYDVKVRANKINAEHGSLRVPLIGDAEVIKTGPDSFSIEDAGEFTGVITIEEGNVRTQRDMGSGAKIHVGENGTFSGGGTLPADVEITVDGGRLGGFVRFDGPVNFSADSVIATDNALFVGPIVSDDNLVVRPFYSSGFAAAKLYSENPDFAGSMTVEANSRVDVYRRNAIGAGGFFARDGGIIGIGFQSITGEITLDGGVLEDVRDSPSPSFVDHVGVLNVISDSSIRVGNTVGPAHVMRLNDVVLDDGVTLSLDHPRGGNTELQIEGNLVVRGEAADAPSTLATGTVRTRVLGTVVGEGPHSHLQLSGNHLLELGNASISVPDPDSTLLITTDTTEPRLNIRDQISGAGTILNRTTARRGSTVHPGGENQIGSLTFDSDLYLSGTVDIEFADAALEPGVGWDVLHAGQLVISEPVLLQVSTLPGELASFDGESDGAWLIATSSSEILSSVGPSDIRLVTTLGSTRKRTFSVRQDQTEIYLDYGLRTDFTGDGVATAEDADLFCASPDNVIAFDWNEDGLVDSQDLHEYLDEAVGTRPGDIDFDGEVTFRDFLTLAANFGQKGGWSSGDFDCSGDVQFRDFVMLAQNFGVPHSASASAATSVPEPASNCLALMLIAIVAGLRRTRVARVN